MGIYHPTDLRRDLFGRCLRKRNRQDALAQSRVLKVRWAGVSAGSLSLEKKKFSSRRRAIKARIAFCANAQRAETIDHVVPVNGRVCFYRRRGVRKHRNVRAGRALRARVLAAEKRVLFF